MTTRGRISLDSSGRLTLDVPCLQCGYNLRGSDPDGNCPECGAAVAPTLRDQLVLSDRAWLARVVQGFDLAILSAIIFCGYVLFITLSVWGYLNPANTNTREFVVAMTIVPLVCILLNVLALFSCTSPEPCWMHPRHQRTARWARWSCLAFLLIPLPALVEWLFPRIIPAYHALLILLCLAPTVFGYFLARHICGLVLRIPARNLANGIRITPWLYLAATALLFTAAVRSGNISNFRPYWVLAMFTGFCLFLAWLVWTFVVLIWCRVRFARVLGRGLWGAWR